MYFPTSGRQRPIKDLVAKAIMTTFGNESTSLELLFCTIPKMIGSATQECELMVSSPSLAPRPTTIRACTCHLLSRLLSGFRGVSRKNIGVNLFTKSLTLHTFLYKLCLGCIYYKTNLGKSLLYHPDSWAVSCAWRTVSLSQGCTCP
jgi:hypothetical protein